MHFESLRKTTLGTTGRSRLGFSLTEATVGIAIFGFASAGLITGMLHARRMAENNVFYVTAITIAQGYVEQMKNMEYVELGLNPIPTKLDREFTDFLSPGEWNIKKIDIYDTSDTSSDDLRMWIRPLVTEITTSDRRYEVSLQFRWEAPAPGGGFSFHEDRIDFIRSFIPAY